MSLNIIKFDYKISKIKREVNHGHKAHLFWFTGLSGSGKSTLANLTEAFLYKKGFSTYDLDGDNIRSGINKDLNFSLDDRRENIRRISEISKLMIDAGIIVIASFVSPLIIDRENAKKLVGNDNFSEIYVNASMKECEKRDVKGLYKKARSGDINNMTGISSPYEPPINPDLEVKTDFQSIEDSFQQIIDYITNKITLKL